MTAVEKTFISLIGGNQDRNVKFKDLQKLLDAFGFECRIKGDHYIYYKDGVPDIINIQPDGNMAKPYQVKQIRCCLLKYHFEF